MTNEKILKKAIEKAEKNGWKHKYRWTNQSMHYLINDETYPKIIFSHDFAKAFWGESIDVGVIHKEMTQGWEYHLERMVLEPKPLKYLERFLDEK